MAPGALGGGGGQGCGGGGLSLHQVPCAPLLSAPLFTSTGQMGDLGKSSQLGLVQGAELAPGLGWSWDCPPFQPLAGAGGCRRPPPHSLGLWETSLPLTLEAGRCLP